MDRNKLKKFSNITLFKYFARIRHELIYIHPMYRILQFGNANEILKGSVHELV